MTIKPLEHGGRRIKGNGPYGHFDLTLDAGASKKQLRVLDEDGCEVGRGTIEILGDDLSSSQQNPDCANRGEESGESDCATCKGNVRIKLFACTVHGQCHRSPREVAGVKSCIGCADAQARLYQ